MYMRRFFAFVISAFLIFFPVYSYATTSTGGWTALDTITAGATNTINATKTAGGKVLNSAVTVGASASKVGKHLIKGGGQAALAYAVVELADGAIDWVLDPANNRVKYTIPSDGAGDAPVGKIWMINNFGTNPSASQKSQYGSTSVDIACSKAAGLYGYTNFLVTEITATSAKCVNADNQSAYRPLVLYTNPAYDPNAPTTEEKYIPISTVADKVISNAEAGHGPSQEAVKATALEGFAAGEHDAALDAAAVESDAGTDNPTDPNNPADPADPVPFDPSSIIAAINSLKALLAGILSSITGMADSVTSLFDWTQEEPPEEEAPVPVPYGELGDVGLDGVDRYEERINFAGQCPANDFSFSMLGVTYSKPIPYHYFCGFLEQIAPWLLAMCYLGTAYFVVENV